MHPRKLEKVERKQWFKELFFSNFSLFRHTQRDFLLCIKDWSHPLCPLVPWTLSISLHIHHYTTFIMPKMGGMYEMDWQVLRALLSPLLFRLSIILSRLVACLWFGKKGHRRSNIIVMLRYNFQRMMWCFFIFQGHIMWLLRILHSIFLVFCFFVSFFRLRCN